ncbi:hypothetical protein I553_6448 [Mycobacterium xenopi 4042]|uniref:Uncharacterized protein n=1 Tax=Mycobacterium xenopi 4042 TaxID=1299334 RepID=X8BH62_MYCXE|nr:hypothetical protein I553_6448 [Mycobacterium xenopi 4042]
MLWQAIALAAVLSAFSAGIAIASRLLMPGPDGRPTASVVGGIGRLGWPLWTLYVGVFTLTVLVGARLAIAVLRVAIGTRRRRAHHRMLVDLLGVAGHGVPAGSARGPATCASSGWRNRSLTVCPVYAAAWCSAKARWPPSPTPRSRPFSATSAHTCGPATTWFSRDSPRCTPRFPACAQRRALDAVQLLVELLADDAAVRTAGRTPLARALVACASGQTPSAALAAGGPSTVLRVRRLSGG